MSSCNQFEAARVWCFHIRSGKMDGSLGWLHSRINQHGRLENPPFFNREFGIHLHWLVLNPPTLLLICSLFSRENGYLLLICSSLSTAQFMCGARSWNRNWEKQSLCQTLKPSQRAFEMLPQTCTREKCSLTS